MRRLFISYSHTDEDPTNTVWGYGSLWAEVPGPLTMDYIRSLEAHIIEKYGHKKVIILFFNWLEE
jgi:hypothetical protein